MESVAMKMRRVVSHSSRITRNDSPRGVCDQKSERRDDHHVTPTPPARTPDSRVGGGSPSGVDQPRTVAPSGTPASGSDDQTARKVGPTVGYCDKAVPDQGEKT